MSFTGWTLIPCSTCSGSVYVKDDDISPAFNQCHRCLLNAKPSVKKVYERPRLKPITKTVRIAEEAVRTRMSLCEHAEAVQIDRIEILSDAAWCPRCGAFKAPSGDWRWPTYGEKKP